MVKILLAVMVSFFMQGCAKPETASKDVPVPEVDNVATRYVNNLQMDVKAAQSAVNRMNRASERTENAVNQSQAE